jgi:hypothetical protein
MAEFIRHLYATKELHKRCKVRASQLEMDMSVLIDELIQVGWRIRFNEELYNNGTSPIQQHRIKTQEEINNEIIDRQIAKLQAELDSERR